MVCSTSWLHEIILSVVSSNRMHRKLEWPQAQDVRLDCSLNTWASTWCRIIVFEKGEAFAVNIIIVKSFTVGHVTIHTPTV